MNIKLTWKGFSPVAGPSYWVGFLGDIENNIRIFGIHPALSDHKKFRVTCFLPGVPTLKKPCVDEETAKKVCKYLLNGWLKKAGVMES